MIDVDKLKYYRELNNLSIKDLSKKIHVSKKVIESWENGLIIPREDDIDKLSILYNIDKCLLYMEEKYKINIVGNIITFIISVIVVLLIKDKYKIILLPLISIILFNSIDYIKYIGFTKEKTPKSLFGIELTDKRKERIIIYLIESLVISSIYVIINMIIKLLSIDMFIYYINIFKNNIINSIFIDIIIFILLCIISFIIEYIFGELIKRVDKSE